MLLSITNSHEGNVFVNQSTTDITNFVTQLFPLFGKKEIEAVVTEYSELGSPADQANDIMGDCMLLFSLIAHFIRTFGWLQPFLSVLRIT